MRWDIHVPGEIFQFQISFFCLQVQALTAAGITSNGVDVSKFTFTFTFTFTLGIYWENTHKWNDLPIKLRYKLLNRINEHVT